jgi:CheY-like chemotaxis protein
MIVEDEKVLHNLYKIMLEDTGYGIIHTYDGYEAMEKLQETKPDLIILDVLMNMVTGDAFFLNIKNIPEYADIPVIIITAYSEKQYANLKQTDPNLTFIEKPHLTKERLLDEVEKKIDFSCFLN